MSLASELQAAIDAANAGTSYISTSSGEGTLSGSGYQSVTTSEENTNLLIKSGEGAVTGSTGQYISSTGELDPTQSSIDNGEGSVISLSNIVNTVESMQTQPTSPEVSSTITEASSIPTQSGLGGSVTAASQERNQLVGERVSTNLNDPTIPESAIQTYTALTPQADEFASPTDSRFQVGSTASADTYLGSSTQVQQPTDINAQQMEAALASAQTGTAATQTQLDPGTAAVAALGNLPPEALVQSQMAELTAGLESGNIPLWAQPAVDAIEGQLAARGLSRSSVGQAALTNAIIQAALPMAQQNANAIADNFAQNKANQQQVNLFNAQSAAQLQLQSLSNEQQMAMQNVSNRQQAMLSDQAATNAARQFNATSQAQTDQFMANMKAQIDLNNASRMDAMSQFNSQQANAMSQFVANQQFQREQFNAQNATAIEQSNLQWRRQANQINTAGINSVNQANAMNSFNLSNQALTFMWQELRDTAKWSFEATQNDLQRAAALAQAAMGNEATSDAANASAIASLGAAALNLFNDMRTGE